MRPMPSSFSSSSFSSSSSLCVSADHRIGRVLLDAYGRRHEAQKIYLRQAAARRWVERRNAIRQRGPPGAGTQAPLRAIDHQLRLVSFLPFRPLPSLLAVRGRRGRGWGRPARTR